MKEFREKDLVENRYWFNTIDFLKLKKEQFQKPPARPMPGASTI
jgi:hypothetical protein